MTRPAWPDASQGDASKSKTQKPSCPTASTDCDSNLAALYKHKQTQTNVPNGFISAIELSQKKPSNI